MAKIQADYADFQSSRSLMDDDSRRRSPHERSRSGAAATASRSALPGEARRIGYLYVAPAFILYAAFNLFPLGQGDQRLLLRLGRDHDRARGSGLDNYTRVLHRPGDPRAGTSTCWS